MQIISLELTPIEKRGKTENGEVAPSEKDPYWCCAY